MSLARRAKAKSFGELQSLKKLSTTSSVSLMSDSSGVSRCFAMASAVCFTKQGSQRFPR